MSVISAINLRYVKHALSAMDEALVPLDSADSIDGAGAYLRAITSGNIHREYIVYVPSSYSPERSMPVIINMHGGGGRAQTARLQSLMDQHAETNGFLAVYPYGIGGTIYAHRLLHFYPGEEYTQYFHKESIDDVQFIRDIVDDMSGIFNIGSVYVTGLSNGSMMSYRLACDAYDVISGVCCIAATMLRSNEPKGRMPVLHIHGTRDYNAPYNGGHGLFATVPIDHVPASDNILTWANHDGCSLDPETEERDNYTIYTYRADDWKGAVRLIKVDGLGHGWPGGTPMLSGFIEGDTYNNINACREMLYFFREFCGFPT